jgi:hypothetical protein
VEGALGSLLSQSLLTILASQNPDQLPVRFGDDDAADPLLLHPLHEGVERLAGTLGNRTSFHEKFDGLIGITIEVLAPHASQNDVAIVDHDAARPSGGMNPLADLSEPIG